MPPRLGLCCLFRREPIRFRTTTARALRVLSRRRRLAGLSDICLANMQSLKAAVEAARRLGIGAFRISSGLFPRATHPEVGYELAELRDAARIRKIARDIRAFCASRDIRLSLHPDQFVTLSSQRPEVTRASLRELESQGRLAELLGADTITIHGGGAVGGKAAALERFQRAFKKLSPRVRNRLGVENDDRIYTPSDLLPLCRRLSIPLVYDIHHHRCRPDQLAPKTAARLAANTWRRLGREPYFHISSPKYGWQSRNTRPHADFISARDFPTDWLSGRFTVDVEAKAKESAVLRLNRWIRARCAPKR